MTVTLGTEADYFRSLALLAIGGPDQTVSVADLGMLTTGHSSSAVRSISLTQPDGNDLQLNVGEAFTVTDVYDPIIGATTTTTLELTLVGSGSFSTLATTSDIIVGVDTLGEQYVIFPDGDMPSLLGAALSTMNVQPVGYDFDTGSPICFTRGVLIETIEGPRPVETLKVGDLVKTKDNGNQPIMWIGRRRVGQKQFARNPGLAPVRIKAGALGRDTPAKDLWVSPQHRILARSKIVQRMFNFDEILVSAKQLTQLEGVEISTDVAEIEYFHFMFERHEVVFANGTETESLYAGPQALKSVNPAARLEIINLFPELNSVEYRPVPVREIVSGRRARKLAARHIKNNRPFVDVCVA